MSFFQLGRQQEILFLVQLNYFLKEVVSNLNQIIFSTFDPSNLKRDLCHATQRQAGDVLRRIVLDSQSRYHRYLKTKNLSVNWKLFTM